MAADVPARPLEETVPAFVKPIEASDEPRTRSGPLTWAQLAIWEVLHWLPADDTSLTLSRVLAIPGDADLAHVRRALGALLRRHEALRTVYFEEHGQPQQRVLRDIQLESASVELASVESGEEEFAHAVRRTRRALCAIPFDLSSDPPLRARVVDRAGRPAALVLTVCHMAADAWSFEIIIEDLEILLAAERIEEAVLEPAGWQPLDRLAYERSEAGEAREAHALRYWEQTVRATPSSMLEGLPGPVRPNIRWARIESAALAAAARALARRAETTPAMVLLGATAHVLATVKGQEAASLRLLVATRFRPETKRLVGAFNQNALFHTPVDPAEPFAQYLRRVPLAAFRSYAYSECDPRKVRALVDAIAAERGVRPGGYCFFNDMSFRAAGEPRADSLAVPHDLRALTQDTVLTEPPARSVPMDSTFFMHLLDLRETAVLDLCVDARFLAPTPAPRFLRDLEELVVSAAQDDTPCTAAP
jgi:Condensation domain